MLETPTTTSEKLYLLSALLKEEAALAELVQFVGKHNAIVKKSENLGSRTLSFPVLGERELLLTSIFFMAEPSAVASLEKALRHEEYVKRFLLTDWKGDIDAPVRKRRDMSDGAKSGRKRAAVASEGDDVQS